jgi:tetratricopeptide (TPR) repeat protein
MIASTIPLPLREELAERRRRHGDGLPLTPTLSLKGRGSIFLALLLLAAPAFAQPASQPTREQTLDRLLGLLKIAPDEQTAGAVERSIQGQWLAQATPATKLLLLHGFNDLTENHPNDALDDFDAALDLQPDLQEGWHGRAMARAQLGDTAGATRDIAEVLSHEPRQFAALEDLSRIAEQQKNYKGAYEAWQRALELDPKTPGGADRLKDLKTKAFGENT